MALWDIIEKIFNIGANVGSNLMKETEDKYYKMQDQKDRLEVLASRMTDEELKIKFRGASGMERLVYGNELKDRGYGE